MECLKASGYYRSTKDFIPKRYGSYFYSITFMERNINGFEIKTERGILCNVNPRDIFEEKSNIYRDLIIDYIIHIGDFMTWDKMIIKEYNDFMKKIGIKISFCQITSHTTSIYNRQLAIEELLHIKYMINKCKQLKIVFLNGNITNLYGL